MNCFKIENNGITLIADTEKSVYGIETEKGGVKQRWEMTEKPNPHRLLHRNQKEQDMKRQPIR